MTQDTRQSSWHQSWAYSYAFAALACLTLAWLWVPFTPFGLVGCMVTASRALLHLYRFDKCRPTGNCGLHTDSDWKKY